MIYMPQSLQGVGKHYCDKCINPSNRMANNNQQDKCGDNKNRQRD